METQSLLVVIGIVLIVEGMPWFISPSNTKKMLVELMQMNDRSLRTLGLIFMFAGLLFVYLGR